MFASDHQCNATCFRLLKSIRLESLWTSDGPSDVALDYHRNGSPLSHGESLMLELAFDLHGGTNNVRLMDLVGTLDETRLRAVLEALYVIRPDIAPRPR